MEAKCHSCSVRLCRSHEHAIGLGVLEEFNDNDPRTTWEIGILDDISAGILAWVGLVQM